MEGQRIANLKKALEKFLEILPKDSFFNIVSFGSSFELYNKESIKFTPESLERVAKWIKSIQNDMGGTEILNALQQATILPLKKEYSRTIIVITDGDVYNPHEIINHAREYSKTMRFCGVGIGYGVSEHLVKNLAKAGNCASVFVQDNEDLAEKAIFLVKSAVSHSLSNIKMRTECFGNKEEIPIYVKDEDVGMLLKDQVFQKWIYLKGIEDIKFCKVKLQYYHSLRQKKFAKEVQTEAFEFAERTDIWHKVAYDAKIRELDLQIKSNDRIANAREEIINLSTMYQILSEYTSFLAVIKENVEGPPMDHLSVIVPNLNSADYSGTYGNNGNNAKASYAGEDGEDSDTYGKNGNNAKASYAGEDGEDSGTYGKNGNAMVSDDGGFEESDTYGNNGNSGKSHKDGKRSDSEARQKYPQNPETKGLPEDEKNDYLQFLWIIIIILVLRFGIMNFLERRKLKTPIASERLIKKTN